MAERLLRVAARRVRRPLEVIGPDGSAIRRQPGAPRMTIHRDDFFHRLGVDGNDRVRRGLHGRRLVRRRPGRRRSSRSPPTLDRLVPPPFSGCGGCYDRRLPAHERNTLTRAPAQHRRHYDLSNELFALFLDETMTYSAPSFESHDEDLADGAAPQVSTGSSTLAGVGPGTHVLEIGTGWGALAIRAAQRA